MKNKLRKITVNTIESVYWHQSGPCFLLHVSPKNDKNTVFSLEFSAVPPPPHPNFFWSFYEISAVERGNAVTVDLGKPKIVAELVHHLITTKKWDYGQGKKSCLCGWELLEAMGYTSPVPIWKREF